MGGAILTSYTPSNVDAYTYYTIYKDSNDNHYFLYTVNNTDLYLKLLSSEESYIVDSAGGAAESLNYKSIIGSNINSSTPHDIYNGNETLVPIPAQNEPGGDDDIPDDPVVPGRG